MTAAITVEGTSFGSYTSGPVGKWDRLGPYRVSVSDGNLVVGWQVSGDWGFLSGLEVWQISNAQRLQVTVEGQGGSTLLSQIANVSGSAAGQSYWEARTYAFVANGSQATLRFQDVSLLTQNVDLLLDRVRVTIKDGPIITQQPVGGTFESGMPAMLSVAVSGTAPLSYQWRRNGNDISGANGSVYVIPSVQAVHDGTYDVVVSNGAGSTTSSSAVVTVHQVFTNGSFESGYDGWTSSGNQNIGTHHTDGVNGVQFNGGNQTPNGVLSQTFTTTIGQAYVLAFDLGVLAWNQDEQRLAVTVTGGSTLVSQIANIFGTGGGNVNWAPKSYSFVADSALTTLTFQDASPTTDSLDVLLDNVRVSSDEPPVITMHPASVSVGAGSPATFSVMASGPPPLAYQWRFNASPIPNATSSSYTLWNAQISDAGNYDVVVANGAGAVTSAAAVLTVTQTGAFNNGSFESSYTAWTASGNQGIASGAPYQATDGIKLVAFNWGDTPPNGVLYQTFATTIGATYVLAFDAGVLAYNFSEQRLQVAVNGSSTLLSQTISIFGQGGGVVYYVPQSFTFTADSAATTLTFTDVSTATTGLDLLLDNVRITVQSPTAVRVLTVNSFNPSDGVSVEASPPDNNGQSSGTTSFTRAYKDQVLVTLAAHVMAAGNSFLKWQKDGVDYATTPITTVTMEANHTLTAVYESGPAGYHTLTISSSNPTSGIAVQVGPPDTSGAGNGVSEFYRVYAVDTVVTLQTPASAFGKTFLKWQKDGVDFETSATIQVTMDANHTLTAVYANPPQGSQTLTVSSSPSGTGVTVWPADSQGVADGVTEFYRTYMQGTSVFLVAPASLGSRAFLKWQKDGIDFSVERTMSVSMNADHQVTAVFASAQPRTLTVHSANPGSGVAVSASPIDINGAGGGATPFARSYPDGSTVTLTAPAIAAGNAFLKWRRNGLDFSANAAITAALDGSYAFEAVYSSSVVAAHLFYNNSAWDNNNPAANADDDNGIATDKVPLEPGGVGAFANYSSYSRGINGVMVDFSTLPGTPTVGDFLFKVGNDNSPGLWSPAPAPSSLTVRENAGVNGSDRFTLIWADNVIEKKWLQVTVLATPQTGLAEPAVFYFSTSAMPSAKRATRPRTPKSIPRTNCWPGPTRATNRIQRRSISLTTTTATSW